MTAEKMLKDIEDFHIQVLTSSRLGTDVKISDPVDKIIILGMGGSALPGEVLKSYLEIKMPIFISRGYDVPPFVDSKTLAFAISYSGNTEETIEAFKAARRKNAKIGTGLI